MRMRFFEKGKWSEDGYRAIVTVIGNNGNVHSFRGSTWPNPFKPKPPYDLKLSEAYAAIAEGEYHFKYSNTAHNGKPGIDIDNNGKIPTICPNPNQDGKSFADHVDAHSGQNSTWRGSAACLTIHPDDYAAFCSVFKEGDKGILEIEREIKGIV